jgi:hypothetical protein
LVRLTERTLEESKLKVKRMVFMAAVGEVQCRAEGARVGVDVGKSDRGPQHFFISWIQSR